MSGRRLVTLLAALVLTLLTAGPAWACSCVATPLPEQVARATLVARVKVAAVDDAAAPGAVHYLVRVDHIWKGPLLSEVLVSSASGSASCGIEARAGDELVLFARDEGGQWRADLCGGTAPAASGLGEKVAALTGSGTPLVPTPGAQVPTPTPAPATAAPAAPAPTAATGFGTAALAAVAAVAAGGIALLVTALQRRR